MDGDVSAMSTLTGDPATYDVTLRVRGGKHPLDSTAVHPERYAACSVETMTEWRDTGARLQIDATTLTRPTGRGYRARTSAG